MTAPKLVMIHDMSGRGPKHGGRVRPGIPCDTGIICGDRVERDAVRNLVRYHGLDPQCADLWAGIYGHPVFVDPVSQIGENELAKPRWPLMFAVFYLANQEDAAATARDWTAFFLAWREGTWNGRAEARQLAERELWATLRSGKVTAYAHTADGKRLIQSVEWDTLEWRDAGLPQAVGQPNGNNFYHGVTIEASMLKECFSPRDVAEGTMPSDVAATVVEPKRRSGRPRGSGTFDAADAELLKELAYLVSTGMSKKEARYKLAERALGTGNLDSKVQRLVKCERKLRK